MSNKKDEGVESSSNTGSIASRLRRLKRSSDSEVTEKKCSTSKSKKEEESSVAAKKEKVDDSVNENKRNSAAKAVSTTVNKVRAWTEVLQASMSKRSSVKGEAQSNESRGRRKTDQMSRVLSIGKRSDSPANKTAAKTAPSEQKAQPDSSSKAPSKWKLKGTSKPPTKTKTSSPASGSGSGSSKVKESAIQKQVLSRTPLPVDVHRASTSASNLTSSNHHIKWKGFEDSFRLEERCCLCQNDISVEPLERNIEDDLYGIDVLPVVVILPCGHVFHNDCVAYGQHQTTEPRCVLCDSQ